MINFKTHLFILLLLLVSIHDAQFDQPTNITEEPTEVTEKPTEVTEKPTDITEEPTEVTEKPTDITEELQVCKDELTTLCNENYGIVECFRKISYYLINNIRRPQSYSGNYLGYLFKVANFADTETVNSYCKGNFKIIKNINCDDMMKMFTEIKNHSNKEDKTLLMIEKEDLNTATEIPNGTQNEEDENSLQTKKEDLLTAIKISCIYETQEDQNASTEISNITKNEEVGSSSQREKEDLNTQEDQNTSTEISNITKNEEDENSLQREKEDLNTATETSNDSLIDEDESLSDEDDSESDEDDSESDEDDYYYDYGKDDYYYDYGKDDYYYDYGKDDSPYDEEMYENMKLMMNNYIEDTLQKIKFNEETLKIIEWCQKEVVSDPPKS